MLIVLAAKLVATAAVVIGVSVTVGKLGPRLGGIMAGMPIVLGPGYFFMLKEQSPAFIREAALSTLHALIATLVFSICFVVSARRLGARTSLALATVCWIPAVLLFSALPGGVAIAVLVYALALLLAKGINRRLRLAPPAVAVASGWLDLVFRGVLAGLLVSVATTLAANSSPLFSGILVGFPIGLLTISWTLAQRYGVEIARATVSMAQQGMLSLMAFCVVATTLVNAAPPMATFLLALLASMAVSVTLFTLSQWQARRRNVSIL